MSGTLAESPPRAGHLRVALVAGLMLAACTDPPASQNRLPAPEGPSVPFGIAALTDLGTIAELRPPGAFVVQVSSHDRTGGNSDYGIGPDTVELLAPSGMPTTERDYSYLYRDGDRYVIFDELGPGVVDRIWMTGLDGVFSGVLGGDISLELDDETSPRWASTRMDLFGGTVPPFLAPLAGDAEVSSGGYYSVLPLPFAKRLRIMTSVVPNWVQITWTRLAGNADVTSFEPTLDASSATTELSSAGGSDPKRLTPDLTDERELAVQPSASVSVWEHDGAGTLLSLELLAPGDVDIPTGLVLEATWDGAAEPQLAAPLDDLFGASLGPGARSLAFGRDGGRYYLYFPMPFAQSARIAIRNDGAQPFEGWRLRLTALEQRLGAHPAYFHAAARSERLAPDGRDYTLLDWPGTGHVVGVVMTTGCAEAGKCRRPEVSGNVDGAHLEGDERISVDGSEWPQIHGTGLEDFFNAGFYFAHGPFTLPTHGNPAHEPTSARRPGLNVYSTYRLMLTDAVPFRSGIRLTMEHGPMNAMPAEMSSVVFYYAVPEVTITQTDEIELGARQSEEEHSLMVEKRVDRALTSAFRGEQSGKAFTAKGLEATSTRFRVAIAPENDGVRLRRLADVGGGRQAAVVIVDGKTIGTWATADINPVLRWALFDFELPSSVTRGRKEIDVELDARESPRPWTAYGYQVWTHVPPWAMVTTQ